MRLPRWMVDRIAQLPSVAAVQWRPGLDRYRVGRLVRLLFAASPEEEES